MMVKPEVQSQVLGALLRKPENSQCADCDSKTPRWASTKFGTYICIRCAGMTLGASHT